MKQTCGCRFLNHGDEKRMTVNEAIRHLYTYSSTNGSGRTNQDQHEEAKRMAIKALEAQRWIPCSERLPEEYGEYRITWVTSASGKRLIGDAEFEVTSVWDNEHDRFKGEWLPDDYIKNYPDVKVLAWKQIEEPWRGEEDGM